MGLIEEEIRKRKVCQPHEAVTKLKLIKNQTKTAPKTYDKLINKEKYTLNKIFYLNHPHPPARRRKKKGTKQKNKMKDNSRTKNSRFVQEI